MPYDFNDNEDQFLSDTYALIEAQAYQHRLSTNTLTPSEKLERAINQSRKPAS